MYEKTIFLDRIRTLHCLSKKNGQHNISNIELRLIIIVVKR